MKQWIRLLISFMFVLAFFMPTSASATSSFGSSNNTSSFGSWFSFFFSSETITVKKNDTSYTWKKDEGKDKEDKDKDWDGCLKEGKKKQNGCKESKDVWHDYYCGIKIKHDHDDEDYEDDFSWAKKGKWIWVW